MVIHLILLCVVGVAYLLYAMLFKNRNYWKDRNVPYVKPLPLFGNYKDFLLLKKHINIILQEICQQFSNEPYVGTFYGTDPALVIQDPNILKLVMSKDFYYCNGREISDHCHKETMTRNMVFATGDEWKVLRTNLTPLFSSSKLKNMFYLIKDSSDALESLLREEVISCTSIDVRSLLSRYTIDCITTCAFGVSADAMKKDVGNNPFIETGKQIFNVSSFKALKNICRAMWPNLFYGLRLKLFEDEIGHFFNKMMSEVFKSREETKYVRNDFVDLILTWRKNKCITGDRLSNIKTGDKKTFSIDVTHDLLLAQCILIFGGGFETTSTSTSYLLYELAKNSKVQDKLIEEVDEYFIKHKEIEYECINRLPYTESCIEESLRFHPVSGFLTREVMQEYSLPTGLSLKKGSRIHIPVYYIHHSDKFFAEPEIFRPERFIGEERKKIIPFTYMPFGEGPRTCIGVRFAKMAMYAALLKIFKKYRVELADDMPHKLEFNPKSFLSQPIGGIHIKFIPRKV